MKTKGKIHAVAYLRTSSATNADGDSQIRQRAAIAAFSKTAGFELVDEFADVAVSGADPIESRAGFAHLLDRIEGNGVRVVVIEDASRLARQLVTQELAILTLIARGVRVLTANGEDLTDDSDPSRVMMRQLAGAFHQYEKARLVAKLKAARDRKRATGARVEGRLSHAEKRPEVVKLAKQPAPQAPQGRPEVVQRDRRGAIRARPRQFERRCVLQILHHVDVGGLTRPRKSAPNGCR
jgi:DNA invertase Pin-like site-specific DNA recombinase